MLRVLKVRGDSLYPSYREGDYVLIAKIPLVSLHPHPGDIVVFHHPHFGILIKRVDYFSPDRQSVFLLGTHPDSIDSRQFGFVPLRDLIGKVVWRIPKPLGK
jgi:nickel-type superoxide dismutase maturation protease